MSTKTIQSVQPKTVCMLPVNVGIVLEANIRKYSFMPSEKMPIVRIAQVDQKNYAINHHDVVAACKQSNKEIRCTVETFQNLPDVMMEHFRDVLSNDVINTPAIYSMVDSLQEKTKKPKTEILKLLGIDKNQYGKLLMTTNGSNSRSSSNMSELAVTELESLVAELSKRKSITAVQASIPQYVLEKISRISDVKDQISLIQFIQLDLNKKNDSRLFWMTPEQIDSVIQMIRQNATHVENKREESTVADFVNIKDIGKQKRSVAENASKESADVEKSVKEKSENRKLHNNNNNSNDKATLQKTKPASKKTKQILDTMPNMIVIPDQNGEPEMLVDKKNGTVSRVDHTANKNIIKTNPIPSKRLYSIPLDVVKFLKVEEDDCVIRHKNISGIDSLESFVKSQNDKTLRFSIFWNEE